MASIVWSTLLPQKPLRDGYQETPPDTKIRSSMDVGIPKVRQRQTAGIRNFSVTYLMTSTQVELLDVFYEVTTFGGTDLFDWPHQRNNTIVEARFVDKPQYQPIGGINWNVSINIEVLP